MISDPPLVGIVPGAFYREYPDSGAGGERIVSACKALEIPCEVIPLPSFASTAHAQELILNWIAGVIDRPVLLVSLSKGSMDLAELFISGRIKPYFDRLRGWISISGLITGTPLIAWYNSCWFRPIFVHALFRFKGYDISAIQELRWQPERAAALRRAVPEDMPLWHLIGVPDGVNFSCSRAARAYRRAERFGVSDGGGVLMCDAATFPGEVRYFEGKDHYLKDIDIAEELNRILRRLQGQDIIAPACNVP